MMLAPDLLGLVISPAQIAIVLGVIVALFAPHLLAPLGRIAGRLVARELRRRLGVVISTPEPPRKPRHEVEVLPPDDPAPTLRAGQQESLAWHVVHADEPVPQARTTPLWTVLVIVSAAVAVLLWYVLHPR